jgi:hypothetical protein
MGCETTLGNPQSRVSCCLRSQKLPQVELFVTNTPMAVMEHDEINGCRHEIPSTPARNSAGDVQVPHFRCIGELLAKKGVYSLYSLYGKWGLSS